MTTLVLTTAGAALGGLLGGPIGAIIGQALGGIAGAQIDTALFSDNSTRRIEGPRLREAEGLASTEGAAIPRVYGRARVGGQLIWATRFEEEITTTVTRSKAGGKAMGGGQKTAETTYAYYANIAIGICEGPITFVRRIWADGREVDALSVTMRVHGGTEGQAPDPLIAAKEAGETPAYRGLAYIVFERFALADYGNRVPQFSFEVVRAVDGLRQMVKAVTLIPGAGEFVYEQRLVSHEPEPGVTSSLTRNQLFGGSDIDVTRHHLNALCPNLRRIALVIAWFGDDLRAGSCSVAPRVEVPFKPTIGAVWSVAGLPREAARIVSQNAGRPAYGGTPSDESVIDLIRRLRDENDLDVVIYPFLLMDIQAGNDLPHPVSGTAGQPAYPWRGRITCGPAIDGTAEAAAQVASFVGTVAPVDMAVAGAEIVCAKPDEWSYRRLVMHCAALAQAAGGVHGFSIGSELVGLTRVRGEASYPMVDALVSLAADVRQMLPDAKLTYAADWTEYGADVREGGAQVRFPLDPLWASPAIDAIGIDFYAPLSDWRDAVDHADAATARGPTDPDYLRRRLNSGEAYDWYYADAGGRAAQERLPISDGAYNKPWVFRAKDLAGWWSNAHVERSGGVETSTTPFQPGAKPIWLTETGVPAIDKGGNGPHFFPDPKSADAGVPYFSGGGRDDLVQARGLEAILSGFDPALPGFEPARNPVHPGSGLRMVDPGHVFVWCFDARPFPAFPALNGVWADGNNFERGHWLNGRIEGAPLDRLVRALLADFGVPAPDTVTCDGFLDGYVLERPLSLRQALEPLAQTFGFDAVMSAGRLVFRGRGGHVSRVLSLDDLVPRREGEPYELRRAQETELPRELRLGFSDGEAEYRRAAAASRRLAGAARRENAVETAIVTRHAEAQRLADQRLQEAWAGRETVELALSPRLIGLEPGDVVSLLVDGGQRLFRLTSIADGTSRSASARSVEPAVYVGAGAAIGRRPVRVPPALPGRPLTIPLSLPLSLSEPPPLLSLAAFASPWPGALGIWQADEGGPFSLLRLVEAPSIVGETLTALAPGPLWRSDRRASVDVLLRGGTLASIDNQAALAGGNALALIGPDGTIEVVTAASAVLVGDRTYRLSELIRGIGGSEAAASRLLVAGARVVVLDGAAVTLTSDIADLGRTRRYRVGPAGRDVGDPTMSAFSAGAGMAALLPLAPTRVQALRTEAGVSLSWIRRTRVGGDSWEIAQVPLGEASEAYEVAILDGESVVTSAATATPGWLYPAALETAHFGAARQSLDVAVAQLSAVVGRGREWRGRIAVR